MPDVSIFGDSSNITTIGDGCRPNVTIGRTVEALQTYPAENSTVVATRCPPVLNLANPGIQGPPGISNLFIQDDEPGAVPPYMWIQTGLGGGSDFTIWVNY